MSVLGVGIDLIELDQFERFYTPGEHELLNRCFTAHELSDIDGSANWTSRLAARFAGKEAVLKVLGGLRQGTALTDIEIVLVDERPEVRLSGEVEARSRAMGIASWHVSLTHTGNIAGAVAVASR